MEKTYGIRILFNHGNAITLDLKGCGSLYIKPGKDYYFTNAPIEFTNYLAQLRRAGVTYKITDDRKGCYQTIDLTSYRMGDPRTILSNLRRANVVNEDSYLSEKTKKEIDKKREEKKVVLSSDDLIKKEKVKKDKKDVSIDASKDENVNNNITESPEINTLEAPEVKPEPIIEDKPVVEESTIKEEVKEEVKTYSEEELNKMSKNKLLEVAKSYGIEDVSEINTKKEIREAILKVQK